MSAATRRFNKARLAPTPSGFLHLGNVLSFAITASLARETGAKILLRIDDLDRARADEKYIQDIFDTLNFLKIPWDEGPRDAEEFGMTYSQLHRMPLYQDALQQLADKELVYACTCSRKQINHSCNCRVRKLSLDTPEASWRLITGDVELNVKNYNGEYNRVALPAEMRDFVVMKKDGLPAYQLSSVVDDLFYGVDLIIRGDDLWPSTLAQHELAGMLSESKFGSITFHHHALLKELSGEKLSKSAGATSVRYLREQGGSPADIYSMIVSMLGVMESIDSWQQLAEIAG